MRHGRVRGAWRCSWSWSALAVVAWLGVEAVCARSVLAAWVGVGPQWKEIKAVTVAPDNPLVRFAGSFGTGVFRSADGGVTWVVSDSGMTNTYVRSLLAITSTNVFAGTNDGVYHSTDGGVRWALVLPTLFSVRSLARDPATGRIYAGTYGDDFYTSATGGGLGTWTKSYVRDSVSGQLLRHIHSVAVYGRDSVYAGGSIKDIVSGGALFAKYSWLDTVWVQVQRSIGIRHSVESIAISPNLPDSSLIIATSVKGVYKSTNGGVNWLNIDGTTTPHPLPDTNTACVAFTPGFRLVGTDSIAGFYRRALGDTTVGWLAATGLPGMPAFVNGTWADAPGVELLAGTDGQGVYRSVDSGKTFAPRNAGMMGTAIRDVAFGTSGRLIVGTGFGDKIWYSDNAGASWTQATVPTSNSIVDVERSATAGQFFAGAYATGVLKSTDNGLTWVVTDTTAINHYVRAVALAPTSAATVYAGTGNGVWKTVNGGTSWVRFGGTAPDTIPFSTSIHSLGVSPFDSAVVLAGTDSSFLYRSINGGGNWTHVGTAGGFGATSMFIRTIDFDPTTSGRVYAGCDSGRVYGSTNNGAAWALLATLPTVNSVRAIRVDPALGSRLFAATFGGGIFASENGGTNWTNISAGLPDSELYVVEIDPAGPATNLYLGSRRHGLFEGPYSAAAAISAVPASLSFGYVAVSTCADLTFTVQNVGGGSLSGSATVSPPFSIVSGSPYILAAGASQIVTVRFCPPLAQAYSDSVRFSGDGGAARAVTGTASTVVCSCPCFHDPKCDGITDILDVVETVNRAFRGAPPKTNPECPREWTDMDCSGSTDIVDVVKIVNVAFRGMSPASQFCKPCP